MSVLLTLVSLGTNCAEPEEEVQVVYTVCVSTTTTFEGLAESTFAIVETGHEDEWHNKQKFRVSYWEATSGSPTWESLVTDYYLPLFEPNDRSFWLVKKTKKGEVSPVGREPMDKILPTPVVLIHPLRADGYLQCFHHGTPNEFVPNEASTRLLAAVVRDMVSARTTREQKLELIAKHGKSENSHLKEYADWLKKNSGSLCP